MPKSVILIFGTRPEAIKMAPLIKALKSDAHFSASIAVTAQHREILDQVLRLFSITPDYDLNIMRKDQTPSEIVGRAITGLDKLLRERKPDAILVQGDTTTALAAALAGYHLKIKVGHVEAGLRTGDKFNPFPEEINRRLIGQIADFHFAPTQRAKENLAREGITENVFVTGNTVVDALKEIVQKGYVFSTPELSALDYSRSRVILLTSHRRESWGKPLKNICEAVVEIVRKYPDVEVVFPIHPNPKIRKTARNILNGLPRIHLLEPLNYGELINLMNRSHIVMTDSGGIQEEAATLGKPILTLRKMTERPEGVEAGVSRVVGTDRKEIVEQVSLLLDDGELHARMSRGSDLYGDGTAGLRIAALLKELL
ncbi:MAG: non-hydrolyzing UDP-N-acetylglucosamine 2-epimerase [bacterium]